GGPLRGRRHRCRPAARTSPEGRPDRRDARARTRCRATERAPLVRDGGVGIVLRRVAEDAELLRARRPNGGGGPGRDLAGFSDEALLALVTRGEENALAELYDRY